MKKTLITLIIIFLTIQPNFETKTMVLNLGAIIGFFIGRYYQKNLTK